MVRIKQSENIIIPLIISIILFIVPFFWLAPGEMDLGGDSSRLYFYDPMSYLKSSGLYVISPSSFGFENFNYLSLPFVSLLIILRFIISSPTILISVFYGFSLSMAFVFCYLVIRELIDSERSWYAAAIGALMYVLSPALIDGWKHVLITYNQIFLNPMMFYLLLKYFKTSKLYLLLIVVILTFIFSPNFSAAAAPAFFAFYPLSILFLFLYAKVVIKRRVIFRHILLGLVLFMGVQAFHIFIQVGNAFSPSSAINATIFSDEGKFGRGLSYFSAIAPNVKASFNLFMLPQMKFLNSFSSVFFISPFVIVSAFLFNKKKTILLTTFFFLMILFFATANITNIWLSFYKLLFNIPGFSMFRNFYGQWQYVYIFFYSILFGQALYILLRNVRKKLIYPATFLLVLILLINATPLIKGDFTREILWQSNNIESVIEMDPDYEEALSFVRNLAAEGRVLTLPFSDPGYQIIAGKNGGAYMGPSTIAYLGGKKDFAGYDELLDYKNLILKLARDNKLRDLKRILGVLNVKYIFYSADPIIYDEFPAFPYQHVRNFLPNDQASYKKFIQQLDVREIKNVKNKFFVFELQDEYYLPQINITKKSIYFNKQSAEIGIPLSLVEDDSRIAVFNYGTYPVDSQVKFDEVMVDIRGNSSLSNLINSTNKSKFGFPFVSWSMTSPVYPYIVFRESQELRNFKNLDQTYIDRSIFFAEKRIAELEKWGKETKLLGNVGSLDSIDKSWKEPNIFEAIILKKYNFWEISLLRYRRAIYNLIDKVDKAIESDHLFIVNKDRIRRGISNDKEILYRIIQFDKKLSKEEKIYLLKLSINMFLSIEDRLQFVMPSLDNVSYDLSILEKGNHNMYIDKKSVENYGSDSKIIIDGRNFLIKDLREENEWLKAADIEVKDDAQSSLSLRLSNPVNIISETKWESVEEQKSATDSVSLQINDFDLTNRTGLTRKIHKWNEASYYLISFDYITYGKSFKLLLSEKKQGKNQTMSEILSSELKTSKWKDFKSLVSSGDDVSSALMQIIKLKDNDLINQIESQDQITKIDIKNLSIVQIPNPKIVLRKINKLNQNNMQSLTFTRINPIKYEVKVENATSPYTLVLINKFSEKWRVIDPSQNTQVISSFFSRFIASIGKEIFKVLGDRKPNKKIVQLSYFDGEIKENINQDMFINEKTFGTWGKNEIAEYKHFPVNGYSNAWYIEPKDMNGKNSYTIILEMTTQKIFYVSLTISILTLVLTTILLIKNLLKK